MKSADYKELNYQFKTKVDMKTKSMNKIKKKKHFSMERALKFWDNFDVELYRKILIKKKESMNMSKKLLENYEKAVNEIIERFCKKQGLYFEYWTGDCVGEVACFGYFFFNFDDIIHDLKNDAPRNLIIDWYFDQLDNENQRINYRSYIMGARFKKILK